MPENQTERRNSEERRESARRGTGPELSVEQVFDREFDKPAANIAPEEEQRFVEQRFDIRRKDDRELDDFISDTGSE